MKRLLCGIILLGCSAAVASTKEDCLKGNSAVCREIFSQYGRQSDRTGAVELFEKACSSQELKITCRVISSEKSETLRKSMEMAKPNSTLFVINGSKIDKIYELSEIK